MGWFIRRSSAAVGAAFAAMAVTVIATPAISSAECASNMSWNRASGECIRPTPPPDWYVAPPAYAPSFAAQDVPPPPPLRPAWSPNAPMWSVGFHQWGAYFNGVWVPY
jgi:hypothetical protein